MRSHLSQTTIVFAFLIVALLFSFALAYRTTSQIADGESWLIHTYTVLGELDSLELSLRKADRNALEFVRTGNADLLTAYRRASSEIDDQVAALHGLTRDNPSQQSNYDALAGAVSRWRQSLERAAIDRTGFGATLAFPSQDFQTAMDSVRKMKSEESGLLKERSVTAASSLRITRIGILVSIVGNLCFLVLAAYLIIKGERERLRGRGSRLQLAAIVDSSDDAIISKTLDGILTSWNFGAEKLYGYKAEEVIGKSINIIIPPDRRAEMERIFETLRDGHTVDHLETVRVKRDGTPIQVEITVSPVHDENGKIIGASAIGRNVTERKQMEESLRQLSVRILQAEDEERRRIARDLHDTTVQELALLSMNLAQLKGVSDAETLEKTLNQAHQLTNQCVQELRTLSYVLHPPMLDELGLASALKIYAEGFSQRSGIALDIEVSPGWERLSPQTEIALFRVAQESLGNVVRHSGSAHAIIRLERNGEIRMAVIDKGRGLPDDNSDKEFTWGVGILGMRERIKQLGGSLTIDSGPDGTSVEARLPYSRGMDGETTNPDRG